MTNYSCERCLKEFSQKSHYYKHLKKKKPCQDNKGKIEEVVENIIINKKLISNNTENKSLKINTMALETETEITFDPKQEIQSKNNNSQAEMNIKPKPTFLLKKKHKKVATKIKEEPKVEVSSEGTKKKPNNSQSEINTNTKNCSTTPIPTLVIDEKEMTKDSKHEVHKINDNITLYIGDSINIKKEIENEGLFRMIYFDPPFNSNRDYNLNCDSNLGFSDKWSDKEYEEFIKKHIDLLYELLEENGTLFFHISSSCMYIPEKILRNKFKIVEPIFWKKCRSKNNVKTKLGSVIDIIWKCNKINNYKFNLVTQQKDPTYLKNSFKNKDNKGNYSLGHLVTENTKKGYIYTITIGNKTFNPTSGWRIKEEALKKLIEEDRVYIPTKKGAKLYKKIYLNEHPGKPCTDLWDDIHSISQGNEERKYPTAKPIKLLERLIEITTDEGDYVYDPMCGSGTTAKASNNLNRKCIINDINSDVIKIVKSRFDSSF